MQWMKQLIKPNMYLNIICIFKVDVLTMATDY
jgi:hypothetical protein